MKLFVDSGNISDIAGLVPLGIIDGVTTNPSLLAAAGGDPRAVLKEICALVKGPVSAEVVARDVAGMVREGRELAGIDEQLHRRAPSFAALSRIGYCGDSVTRFDNSLTFGGVAASTATTA